MTAETEQRATRLGPAPGSRIAVVGGCGGIGRCVVAAARALGCDVAVLDIPASLQAHPPPGGAQAAPIDVTDAASVRRAFAMLGARPLHGVVNLAGFALEHIPVGEVAPENWDAVIAANLTGAFHVVQAALPLLRASATEAAPSAIVHAASGLATRVLPGYGPYSAAKAGLIALTKSVAIEYAPLVRANAVAPGAVNTAFLAGGTGRGAEGGAARLDMAAYTRTVPMRRIAEPEDVAGPVMFLLSPAAAFITGQVIWINGGGLTP